MIVIGVDPGKTTGLVAVMADTGCLRVAYHAALDSLAATRWLQATLADEGVLALAVERFIIAPRTITGSRAGAMDALYTIGAARHIADQYQIPLTLQTASAAKNAVTDTYLRDVGLAKATKGPHERDALRHALLYMRTHDLWDGVTVCA